MKWESRPDLRQRASKRDRTYQSGDWWILRPNDGFGWWYGRGDKALGWGISITEVKRIAKERRAELEATEARKEVAE